MLHFEWFARFIEDILPGELACCTFSATAGISFQLRHTDQMWSEIPSIIDGVAAPF